MTEASTRYRYRQMWKKFIAFVVRAWLLPDRIRRQVKAVIPREVKRQVDMGDTTRRKWQMAKID